MTPRYGFNFQWMFSWEEGKAPTPVDERALDFLARFGFNFVRIPTDYRFWTHDFDYLHPDEKIWPYMDSYIAACQSRGLHASLNLHRAPGYCINFNHLERDNLWLDEIAQDAFIFLWELFARRYKGISGDDLSFDLVNEPPSVGQYGMTREGHESLIRKTVEAIRTIDPDREIVIDGLGGGNLALPELADLGVVHSTRGYQPMPVSHYKAQWWSESESILDPPIYPGQEWAGRRWNREVLHDFYKPWLAAEALGAIIHVGEFGCYNQTENDVALRWLADLIDLFAEFGWGYALWEFKGPFGIVEHGRPGTVYEEVEGYRVDRALLDLLLRCKDTSM